MPKVRSKSIPSLAMKDEFFSKIMVGLDDESKQSIVNFFKERMGTDYSFYTLSSDDLKPKVITNIIDQITAISKLGSEIDSWSVSYYPAPTPTAKGFSTKELQIERASIGTMIRHVIPFSKDIAYVEASLGKASSEKKILISDSQSLCLPIGICSALNIKFKNCATDTIIYNPRGGRPQLIKKTVSKRHVLVLDAHPNSEMLAENVLEKGKEMTGIDFSKMMGKGSSSSTTPENGPVPYPDE